MRDVFSEISLTTVEKFKFARYVIISPNPEERCHGIYGTLGEKQRAVTLSGLYPQNDWLGFPFCL